MSKETYPSAQELNRRLAYDPLKGSLSWKRVEGRKNRYSGQPAFTSLSTSGYPKGAVDGVSYSAHRVIWAMVYGAWPSDEIDHINGDKTDNRIANLRLASRQENMQNRGLTAANTSGRKGITWLPKAGKWQAQGRSNGRAYYLGIFSDLEDAAKAYEQFSRDHHGHHSVFVRGDA